jgi:threonine synthase
MHDDMKSQFTCEACNGWLEASYDIDRAMREFDRAQIGRLGYGSWRWRAMLPIREESNIVSLGEGGTPLIRSRHIGPRLRLKNLMFKDLSRSPTCSFKDYSSTVTVSKAREIRMPAIAVLSAGNGASSTAAYCAAANLPFYPMIFPTAYPGAVASCMIYGARGFRLPNNEAETVDLVLRIIREGGWMNATVPLNPYRAEGKKVIGYEIAEALDWRAPDRIVCPTAGGASMLGLRKAFDEMIQLEWIERMPRLDCVQAESCAPVVDAWRNGGDIVPAERPNSIAVGLLLSKPPAGPRLVNIINQTGGQGVAVTDPEIIQAQLELAREEGLFVEPSSAAALAGLKRIRVKGLVADDETIVLMLTGSGTKAAEVAVGYAPEPKDFPPAAED